MSRLHRVAIAPKGPPPTTAEIEKMAAHMCAAMPALRAADPGLIAEQDQTMAHEQTTMSAVRALAEAGDSPFVGQDGPEPAEHREIVDIVYANTCRLAIVFAVSRLVEWRCEHVRWPPDGQQRLVADLTCRAVCCGAPACLDRVQRRWGQSDELCERCEQPSEEFTAHMCPVGALIVKIELCSTCNDWMANLGRETTR